MDLSVPHTAPEQIAPETFLIPNLFPAGPDLFLPVNSMLIRGAEPVIVDTGAPVHRLDWLEKVFGLVDPEDVRWIFLSHDDPDHTAGLLDALERCPKATLVANFFIVERLGGNTFWSSEPTGPFGISLRHWRMMRADCRTSSTRTMKRS